MREETPKHPGPFRVMKVDAEFAGILVAVGFFVMGFVSVPIAKGFLVGAFLVGGAVAFVLWLMAKKGNSRPVDSRILHIEQTPGSKQ